MSDPRGQPLLETLLDSWDRNNTILLNLLGALPEGGLEVRAMESSPSIAQLFTHIHYANSGASSKTNTSRTGLDAQESAVSGGGKW